LTCSLTDDDDDDYDYDYDDYDYDGDDSTPNLSLYSCFIIRCLGFEPSPARQIS